MRKNVIIRVRRAFGPVVEGEAVVSDEGFSPRYDLDRWGGVITKPGHQQPPQYRGGREGQDRREKADTRFILGVGWES